MTRAITILGILVTLAGLVWLLQGIGVIPGSFMSGQQVWAVVGAALMVCGIAALRWSLARARRSD